MSVPEGTRFRVKTFPSGKMVRLAFKGNKVIETKSLSKKRDKGFFGHMDPRKLKCGVTIIGM